MVQVGQKAPEFALEGVLDNEFVDVKLSDYAGTWVVLFFYPLDFTFVCPTEIRGFSSRVAEFDALGAKVIGCSVDSKFSHLAWTERDFGKLDFPLLSDMKRSWTPTACCSRTRASRCAGRSSSTRTACCATRACTTTTSAATPKRPCACCRRCRPASSARSTGVPARRRSGSPRGHNAHPREGSGMSGIDAWFDEKTLLDMAPPDVFLRGASAAEHLSLEILERDERRMRSRVADTEVYEAEFWLNDGELKWSCTLSLIHISEPTRLGMISY